MRMCAVSSNDVCRFVITQKYYNFLYIILLFMFFEIDVFSQTIFPVGTISSDVTFRKSISAPYYRKTHNYNFTAGKSCTIAISIQFTPNISQEDIIDSLIFDAGLASSNRQSFKKTLNYTITSGHEYYLQIKSQIRDVDYVLSISFPNTKTLNSISLSGSSSIAYGKSATYSCTARYSDGTSQSVTPTWYLSSTDSASVSSSGVVTNRNQYSSTQYVNLYGSYTYGGVTKTDYINIGLSPATNPTPSPPTGLSASFNTSTDYILLSWNSSSGASYYQVYRGTSSNSSSASALSGWISGTTYKDTTATPSTLYYYWVKAATSSGGSYASSFSASATGVRATLPPSTVTATQNLSDRITVTWNDSYSGNYYKVFRGTTSSPTNATAVSGLLPSGTTRFDDTNANVGTTYYYWVHATRRSDGSYLCYNSSSYAAGKRIEQAISAPTGLTATSSTSAISLAWNSVSEATHYNVFRSTSSNYSSAISVSGWQTSTSYSDTSVKPCVTYYYWVKAATSSSGAKASAFSMSVNSYRYTDPPTTITATQNLTEKIIVTWNNSATNNYYWIIRNTTPTSNNGDNISGALPPGTTEFHDTTVTPETVYYYWVCATTNSDLRNSSFVPSKFAQGKCLAPNPYDYSVDSDGNATITHYKGTEKNLVIPASLDGHQVIAIGQSAFMFSSIESVTIPEGCRIIDFESFSSCENLQTVHLPSSLTQIDSFAFSFCTSLVSITIPKGVTYISDLAFSHSTNLKSIVVSQDNNKYASKDGVLFSKDMTEILKYPPGKDSTIYFIPSNVTKICWGAFKFCSKLSSINIPNSVTYISYCAFENSMSLTSITIPERVTQIAMYAFSGCDNLLSITFKGKPPVFGEDCYPTPIIFYVPYNQNWDKWKAEGVTVEYLPYLDISPTTRNIEAGEATGSIDVTSNTAWKVAKDVLWITLKSTSGSNNGTISYNVAANESVTASRIGTITVSAEGCDSKTLVVMQEPAMPNSDYEYSLDDNGNATITKYKGSETSLAIPAKIDGFHIVAIDRDAFRYSFVESVTIPEGCKMIGAYAFYHCHELRTVSLPSSLTGIEEYAFLCCVKLESISIPSGVTSIGDGAFAGCTALSKMSVASDNKYYMSYGNVLFNKSKTELLQYPAGLTQSRYTVPDGVVKIHEYAFYECGKLLSIILLSSVKTIGIGTFNKCNSLVSITIPSGVVVLEDYLFGGCSSLTYVILPEGLKKIGNDTFYGCKMLKSIIIPESVELIQHNAFSGCDSLTSIRFKGDPPQFDITDYPTPIKFYVPLNKKWEEWEAPVNVTLIPSTDLDIYKGWNLCALPFALDEDSVVLLKNTGPCWGWNGRCYTLLNDFHAGQGFWLYAKNDMKLTLTGCKANLPDLHMGWNLVSASAYGAEVGNAIKFSYNPTSNIYSLFNDGNTTGDACWIFLKNKAQ